VLDEIIGNEDALDYKSDILLGVLGALSIVIWDGDSNKDSGFERDRAGVALEVVPGRGF